jgi:hypothetical protein
MAQSTNRGSQAREQADEAKGHLQQAGAAARDAASSAAGAAAEKAQETASGLGQRVQDVASNVSQRAGEMASTAAEKTDDAISSVGQRMTSMAGSLRQSAPREGVIGSAATAVADRLETGGRYLQQHGVGEMTDELAGVIRRNPLPALGVAFGVGVLIGLAMRR